MNHKLVPFGRDKLFKELSEEIAELRETSQEDAELMASKVLSRAYSHTKLVGLSIDGKRALYHWDTLNPPAFASLAPFDEREVDSKNAVIVWRHTDEDQSDDFEAWLEPRLDGLDWIHPDYLSVE
ncbi:hypothetical protein [Haladaptatus halobius]|uniref:hypothetical protein n=1 Tax=Haladaptatus halobius TaxID=2884875 RepID=UPI001D0AED41|nr:hypothetical protein [Haladaptatus halobius]